MIAWLLLNPWRAACTFLGAMVILLSVSLKIQSARLEAQKANNAIAVSAAKENANEVLRVAQQLKDALSANAVWKDKADKTIAEHNKYVIEQANKQEKGRTKLNKALDKSDWGKQPVPDDVLGALK